MKMARKSKINEYKSNYIAAVIWCIKLSWKTSKFYTCARISGAVVAPVLSICITYMGRNIINLLSDGINEEYGLKQLLLWSAILMVVTLLNKAIQAIIQYCQTMHSDMINSEISLLVMERSLNCDLEYFDNPTFNDKLLGANQDSYAIADILWNVILSISSLLSFIGIFIVICHENMIYAIILLLSSGPISFVSARYTRSLYKLSIDQINGQRQLNYVQGIAADKFYAQEIRLLGIDNWLKNRYLNIWKRLFNERKRTNIKRALWQGFFECLPEIVIALISIDIACNILYGGAEIGDYVLYTGLIVQLWNAAYKLISSSMEIYSNRLRIDNIKSLDQYRNKVNDDGVLRLNEVRSIIFDRVCFTYPGEEMPTLNNVCISLHNKERVALVGLNGAGKSTLIKLLLRMYDPDSGAIYINGTNIKNYKIYDLRSNFSVYFQDMMNYGFTIRENFEITDLNKDASDTYIEQALSKVAFSDLLQKSSKRCDACLFRYFDSNGIELSGGQFQKLALARVFYRNSSVMILDEPSSNLDPIAEEQVMEFMRQHSENKMTFFISHRLSNVYLADRIIVLENGTVVEDGSHVELLKKNNRYAELFRIKSEA